MSPSGASVTFEDQISTAVAQVNDGLAEHVRTINERLYDLELVVFKDSSADAEEEE